MKHLKTIQVFLLCGVATVMVIANCIMFSVCKKNENMLSARRTNIRDMSQKIATTKSKVNFYDKHSIAIAKELTRYKGVVAYKEMARNTISQRPTPKTQLRKQTPKQAENKADTPTKQEITVEVPAYLAKVQLKNIGTHKDTINVGLSADTEFFRFIEWYTYFFAKYPFSMPKKLNLRITEKNTYSSLPTNIIVNGDVNIRKMEEKQ